MHLIVIIPEFNVKPILFDIHPTSWIDGFGLDGRKFKLSATLMQHLPQLGNRQGLFGRSCDRFFEFGIDDASDSPFQRTPHET